MFHARLAITVIAIGLMSGCVGNDVKGGSLPPMLVYPNNQSRIIVIQGVESGLQWSDITFTVNGDKDCAINAPLKGEIQPGQVIHILGDSASQCIIEVSYKGISLGSYTFNKPESRIDIKLEPIIDSDSDNETEKGE